MLKFLRIGVCVFILTASNTESLAQTGTHDGFELVRHENNILVHERWVTFPKSDPPITAREVKSEFIIRSNVNDALSLMRSEAKIGLWQKHVSEFRIHPHSDSAWYEYSYHDIPWPVSDQDHFLEYTVQDPVEGDGIFVTFETVQNEALAPVRKGVSRMTLSGSWYFQDLPDGRIKVTYRILSMPGNLPRFITDPVIRSNLMSTVRNYINILEKPSN
ncbi:MAG TPA: hypothetical protein VIQ51_09655 [Chryseosolibacter sp.]